MSMRTIEITVKDHEVAAALNRLVAAISDLTPAMRGIAGVLQESSDQAFQDEANPETGEKWDRLSDVTSGRAVTKKSGKRKPKLRGAHPILRVTGKLSNIQSEYGRDYAVAGSAMDYAPTHQFGARQGQYGRSSRGGPIPWGDIPARPFLGIDEVARTDILDILSRHLGGR